MGLSISDFKANVQDLARPNRFLVTFGNSLAGILPGFDLGLQYLCSTAALPGRDIGDLTVNWQGMQIKLAGDPTFNDIQMTFHNDYDFAMRNFFELWLEIIANQSTNERTAHDEYKADVQMDQLGRHQDVVLASYVLAGAYPKSLSTIDLNMDSNDQIENFTVSMRYDNFFRVDLNGSAISPSP